MQCNSATANERESMKRVHVKALLMKLVEFLMENVDPESSDVRLTDAVMAIKRIVEAL